jgi:hypothetical protein
MGDEELTVEGVKAIQEVAKATGITVEAAQTFGQYLGEIFGTVPHDAVGLLGGDRLKIRRIKNFERIYEKSQESLSARGISPDVQLRISERIGIPLLEAASMESDESLQDIWARLIGNALDPNIDISIRQEFIEALRKFEPIDALVLEATIALGQSPNSQVHSAKVHGNFATGEFADVTLDQVLVSLLNLDRANCLVAHTEAGIEYMVSPLGRELVRACSQTE